MGNAVKDLLGAYNLLCPPWSIKCVPYKNTEGVTVTGTITTLDLQNQLPTTAVLIVNFIINMVTNAATTNNYISSNVKVFLGDSKFHEQHLSHYHHLQLLQTVCDHIAEYYPQWTLVNNNNDSRSGNYWVGWIEIVRKW